jgi:hypothetical protein
MKYKNKKIRYPLQIPDVIEDSGMKNQGVIFVFDYYLRQVQDHTVS